jgi:hypothetical protein
LTVLLMWALFRLEKEEKEPSDSYENGKGIALIKDGSNHSHSFSVQESIRIFCYSADIDELNLSII